MSKNSSISNEKSKRRRYDLRGLRTAAIAFVIMALADFSLHAMRMFFKNSMIELAYIGVITIAWLIMLMGTRKIADYNGDFKRAYGATIPAIFACLAWLIIAIVELQRGVGKQTFSSLGIMLMGYIVMLCMLYCYAHLLNGSSVVLDGFRKEKLQKSCRRIWKVSMLLIIIAVLCEQGAPLFPEQIKYMITISAAVVSLIVQMLMIKNLLVVYDIVDGKLEPRRLKDVLDGIKEDDAKASKAEPENDEGNIAKEEVDEEADGDVAPEIADNEEASEEPIEEPDEEATEVLIEEAAAETPDESDEEPQEEEVGESSEELKDEDAEESTEELAGEAVEEMGDEKGDEKIDEAPDESDEEPQEEELGESPEELTDETDDESDEEPADESVDELVEEVRDEQADEPAEKPTGKLTEDKTIDLREILTVVTAKDNKDNSIEENFEEPEAESGFEAPEEPEDEEPSVDDIRFEDEETDAGEIEESEPEELKDEEQSSEDIQFEDEKEEIESETEEPEDEEPSIDDIRFEDEETDAGEIKESESEELKLEDIVFDNEEDDKWKTEELELNEITGQESAEPEEIPEQVQPEEPEDDKITELRNRIAEIRIIEKGLTDPIDRLNAAAERIELEKELRKEIENE